MIVLTISIDNLIDVLTKRLVVLMKALMNRMNVAMNALMNNIWCSLVWLVDKSTQPKSCTLFDYLSLSWYASNTLAISNSR